jgi:hypothetical protein
MKESDLILSVHRRNGHTFILIFQPEQRKEAFRAIARWASDEALPFSWMDAVRMGNEIHKETTNAHG